MISFLQNYWAVIAAFILVIGLGTFLSSEIISTIRERNKYAEECEKAGGFLTAPPNLDNVRICLDKEKRVFMGVSH